MQFTLVYKDQSSQFPHTVVIQIYSYLIGATFSQRDNTKKSIMWLCCSYVLNVGKVNSCQGTLHLSQRLLTHQ